ncbi:uncharacterized protein PV07_12787 [Cladophialophora immunda]|uniref:Uncharacterized protein n=1 Tax=Cladophialophora immunda TaxID=569365 RepID=A0A0D2BTN4_9EURO|nr:uncharacterized protein PV07_12787 [Cladophialophora immunda]KIW21785.1 hypothetical protein PV07_12787 [Cladophialophora immunda]
MFANACAVCYGFQGSVGFSKSYASHYQINLGSTALGMMGKPQGCYKDNTLAQVDRERWIFRAQGDLPEGFNPDVEAEMQMLEEDQDFPNSKDLQKNWVCIHQHEIGLPVEVLQLLFGRLTGERIPKAWLDNNTKPI